MNDTDGVVIPWQRGVGADGLTAGERVNWAEVEARRIALLQERQEERRGLCSAEFEYGYSYFECMLPEGHTGDHKDAHDDEKDGWELTWRNTLSEGG